MQLEVGRITKAHGLHGEVVVLLVSNRAERVAPGSVLQCDAGQLTVARSRPHQDRFLVTFTEITDRSQADGYRGMLLHGEPLDDPDTLWVHELVGCQVSEEDGTERGTVVSVIDNPASDILELDTGALVPLTFLTRHGPGQVVVAVPDGLFDSDGEEGP